jgi:hypothetical protein
MKKAATLVAGLLLVTGTVFADTGFKLNATGSVTYENTVFETDKALLQHNQGEAIDYDDQGFEANLELSFTEKDKLTVTVLDEEDDQDDLHLEFKHDGENTDLTIYTETGFASTDFTLTNEHANGKVKAQVTMTVDSNIYEGDADGASTGESEAHLSTDSDAIYLEYAATDDVTVTFYPYSTEFFVDTVFTDDASADEVFGAGGINFEELAEVAGIKVAYGSDLTVKFGTGEQNTDETTYLLDVDYKKTFAENYEVQLQAVVNTADEVSGTYNTAFAGKVVAKPMTDLTVTGEFLSVAGVENEDFMGIYAAVDYKMDALTLNGKFANKAINGADAINALYGSAAYALAEVNGLKPTVKAEYENYDLDDDAYTVTVSAEATVEQDDLTITPSVEMATPSEGDATTTVKVAVGYSF